MGPVFNCLSVIDNFFPMLFKIYTWATTSENLVPVQSIFLEILMIKGLLIIAEMSMVHLLSSSNVYTLKKS